MLRVASEMNGCACGSWIHLRHRWSVLHASAMWCAGRRIETRKRGAPGLSLSYAMQVLQFSPAEVARCRDALHSRSGHLTAGAGASE